MLLTSKANHAIHCAGFLALDKAMNSTTIDCEFSGSTACVALVRSRQLHVAWVGDSRGVMATSGPGDTYTAVPMTVDHKPTATQEKERILASNGRVERCTPFHPIQASSNAPPMM